MDRSSNDRVLAAAALAYDPERAGAISKNLPERPGQAHQDREHAPTPLRSAI